MKKSKGNGQIASGARSTYHLTAKEREFISTLNGRQLNLVTQHRELEQAKTASLLLICSQQGLDGNYRLSDDLTMLQPVEEAQPAERGVSPEKGDYPPLTRQAPPAPKPPQPAKEK